MAMQSLDVFAAMILSCSCLVGQSDLRLAEAVERYQSAEGTALRISMLEAIAKVTGDFTPADVTRALAGGLRDADPAVRLRAVQLVASAPDRDLAIASIVEACSDLGERWKTAAKSPELPKPGKLPNVLEEPEALENYAAEMSRAADLAKAWLGKMEAEIAVREQLLLTLAGTKDRRAIPGLVSLLESAGADDHARRTATSLLSFATREAFGAAARHVRVYQGAVEAKKKDLQSARRTKHEPPPDYWKGNKRQWEQLELARVARLVEKAEAAVRQAEQARREYLTCLTTFAKERGLSAPPSDLQWSAWQQWASLEGKKLLAPTVVGK